MQSTGPKSVVRLDELKRQIEILAGLRPGTDPVISCYLDVRRGTRRTLRFVRDRLADCARALPEADRRSLRIAGDLIAAQLHTGLPPRTCGVAIFIAADGASAPFAALPFAVPLRNSLSIAASPDLFPLLQLKEMYGRFAFILARPRSLHLAAVNLGEVSTRAWLAAPQARHVSHDVEDKAAQAARSDLRSQVRMAERILSQGRSAPLFLAGDVDMMRAVCDLLTPATLGQLLGVIPVSPDASLHNVAARCLRSLTEFEARQAEEFTQRALLEVRYQGQAVAGLEACLSALRNGSAGHLLLGADYRPETGWAFSQSNGDLRRRLLHRRPGAVTELAPEVVNQRVELVRLAGKRNIPIEFVGNYALRDHGGIACLLRDHPEQSAKRLPPGYKGLDLVA